MFNYLKQSTATQSRIVGPFVDDTDFKTAETGLSIANTDVKLSKNGAAGVNKNSGGGTHRNNGMYSLTFDATDTNTVGELEGSIAVSGALIVTFKFMVLEEDIYDALFGASAAGFNSSGLVTLAAAVHTGATVPTVTTLTNKTGFSLAATGLDAIVSTATGMVEIAKAIWDRVLNGANHNITNSAGKRLRQLVESGNYANGLVWLDTNVANIGSADFQDGTEVNPTSLVASVNTILASLPLHGCHVAAGSSVTFAVAQENQEWTGQNWTLALGGQSIAGTSILDATISGVSTGVPGDIRECFLDASTFAGGIFADCALNNTITLSGATDYHFFNCHHSEIGAPSTIDFGSAVGSTLVYVHDWHGELLILNMKAGDILNFSSGAGTLTLDSTCVAGTVSFSGIFGFTDNSSGMTINDVGAGSLAVVTDAVLVDTNELQTDDIPTLIAALNDLSAAAVNTEVDTAIVDAALSTAANLATVDSLVTAIKTVTDLLPDSGALSDLALIEGRTLSAADIAKLSASVGTIVSGVVETGTLSSTQMTSDLSEATNDHYIGRIILWTSGPLTNQATDITDYVGSNGLLTFTEVTDVPVDSNTFIIV